MAKARTADEFSTHLLRRYAAGRASAQGDSLLAVLHIGLTESGFVAGRANEDARIVRFHLGYAGIPATLFSQDLPTALELEDAIAAVEDEVMPAVRQLDGVTEIVTTDPELRALAMAASSGSDGILPIEQVEWLFNELSRAAAGGPASHLPFACTRMRAAALLILREVMHHGGIRTWRCVTDHG